MLAITKNRGKRRKCSTKVSTTTNKRNITKAPNQTSTNTTHPKLTACDDSELQYIYFDDSKSREEKLKSYQGEEILVITQLEEGSSDVEEVDIGGDDNYYSQ